MSPTPPSRPPFPPRYRVFYDERGICKEATFDPKVPPMLPNGWTCVDYYSKEEAIHLAREAEIKAYEDAILMANARRKPHHNTLVESLQLRIKELRNE